MTPADFINRFSMQPHPEGGYFTSSYHASLLLPVTVLPSNYHGDRPVSTAIYYLVEKGNFLLFTELPVMNAGIFMQEVLYGYTHWQWMALILVLL